MLKKCHHNYNIIYLPTIEEIAILEYMISKMRRCSSSTSMDNRIREPLTEMELRTRPVITPEDVLRLNRITDGLFIFIS